jgi:hygromycin-B 7''-O-kinase
VIERPIFASRTEYGARFTDATFWHPFVSEVCQRHNLPCTSMRAGLPGTNAVFLVDQQYAIKLYPDLFGGAVSFPAERRCYELIAQAAGILAPMLIASGELFDRAGGWHWPYIVTTMVPGHSLGEAQAVGFADRYALATWLGTLLRRIHTLPLNGNAPLRADWGDYAAFLSAQRAHVQERHSARGVLPEHLCAQLDAYLPTAESLVDRAKSPQLLHGDLNRDHVLGDWVAGHWQPCGVIDFGDARVGDPNYDLVALHLGLFDADKRLLQACLSSYGTPACAADLAQRAMALTLLHEFYVLDWFQLAIQQTSTLGELADLLWNLDTPGIAIHSVMPKLGQ